MVILSMHIAGDGPANSYKFGTRRNRKKPPFGNYYLQNTVEREATLAFKNSLFCVEAKDLVILHC